MGDVVDFATRRSTAKDPLDLLLASARARADRLESHGAAAAPITTERCNSP